MIKFVGNVIAAITLLFIITIIFVANIYIFYGVGFVVSLASSNILGLSTTEVMQIFAWVGVLIAALLAVLIILSYAQTVAQQYYAEESEKQLKEFLNRIKDEE